MMMDLKNVRPKNVKDCRRILAKAENFFKHAEKDLLETLYFPVEVTRLFMLEAIGKYHEMAHEQRPLLRMFVFYMISREPHLFKAESIEKMPRHARDKLKEFSKREFFQYGLP